VRQGVEEPEVVEELRGVGVAIVAIATGKSKPVRGLQGVLTIVAILVSSLARMAMMAAMVAMVGMGVMELWVVSR
jgi:hypothetical protein